MRNAVIRKKVIKEQALIRKYMFTPQRIIVPSIEQVDWTEANDRAMRLWAAS